MDRVVVVGNCQAKALEIMLATSEAFSARFEFSSFPPVHEIPEETIPQVHEAVSRARVAILQRIEEGYRDGLGLGTDTLTRLASNATVVRWPSLYWAGYVPDLFYLRGSDGQPVTDGPFDYHDRVIIDGYHQGLDVPNVCRLLEDPERPSGAAAWADNATAELDVRGKNCDIQVTSLIETEFRKKLLFFTMNHPANRLLGFVAQRVLDLIGLPGHIIPSCETSEVLGSTFYPLHANHVRALGLEFGTEFGAGHAQFTIRGVTYKPEDAVAAFFEYYTGHSNLVELNLEPQHTFKDERAAVPEEQVSPKAI
jgi:hypothetical protein